MNTKQKNEIVLFTSADGVVTLDATVERESIWLTQAQMALLFQVERPAITKHLSNIFKTDELDKKSSCSILEHIGQHRTRAYATVFYNLDAIIAVGYRVNSKRATQFRIWATQILRDYILKGVVINQQRLKELGTVVEILKRSQKSLDTAQVLSVVERYTPALDLLDDYDHQRISKPKKGQRKSKKLSYNECMAFIHGMRFGNESPLFGSEKDESFKSSLGAIYQTFGGKELYPTLQEKAATLLYFVIKNHSFTDGNKRIGAALFLYFLDKNGALFRSSGEKRLDDHTLVALTLMIAESKPAEREIMISLVMVFLAGDNKQNNN